MATATFEQWLANALTDGMEGRYVDDIATVNAYATKFNLEIASLVETYGEQQINKAIWYIYGAGSGYVWDATHESLGPSRLEFMSSVHSLYKDGFAVFCSNYFGHLSRGPAAARPMNSACYMLWDMDGIECPAMNGDAEMVEASMDVLRFALSLDNWACKESALHGLGHLAESLPTEVSAVIDANLRRGGLPPDLRTYATSAKSGMVQ